jgi:hypothetical protein
MPGTLIAIAGLPGSGKSTYMRGPDIPSTAQIFDDFHKDSFCNSPYFRHSRHYTTLITALCDGIDCVISDIMYCDTSRRKEVDEVVRAAIPGLQVEWRYFENNAAQCEANVKQRNRSTKERELEMIRELSAKYEIPQDGIIIPIVTGGKRETR